MCGVSRPDECTAVASITISPMPPRRAGLVVGDEVVGREVVVDERGLVRGRDDPARQLDRAEPEWVEEPGTRRSYAAFRGWDDDPPVERDRLAIIGLAIAVGLAGVIVPVLPGALLVWAAILLWALAIQEPEGWAVLGVATVVIGVTQVLKYVLPSKRLQDAGVPFVSMAVGLVGSIAGFFLIPVVGIFLGFPVGVFVSELVRLRDIAGHWCRPGPRWRTWACRS